MAKAISLFSGSLASIVATRLILQEPGVEEVKLLHFRSPFFRDYDRSKELGRAFFNGSFRSQSVKKDFTELANIPQNGGYDVRHCCTGCRKLMIRKALRYMKKVGADFLVTGEIVGVRGLGGDDMLQLARDAGAADRVLRPLSARLLPPTLAERQGWVERRRLKGLTAEDRPSLVRLARKLGIETDGFPAEARCKLVLPYFGQRLEDLLQEDHLTLNGLELLEFPLYYKRPPDVKIVLGRNEEEKRRLQNFFLPNDLRLYVPVNDGPIALVRANWCQKSEREVLQIIELAARITAMHADLGSRQRVQANYRFENSQETSRINIVPFSSPRELEKHRIRLDF
jgi:tRNA-specific 2-thiouridylase